MSIEKQINNAVETLLKVNGTDLVTDMEKYKKALRISVIKKIFSSADDSRKREIIEKYGKEISDFNELE